MKSKRVYFTIDGEKHSKSLPYGWEKVDKDDFIRRGDQYNIDVYPYNFKFVDEYSINMKVKACNYHVVIREINNKKIDNSEKILNGIINHLDGKSTMEIMMGAGNGYWLVIANYFVQEGKAIWEDQHRDCFTTKLHIFKKVK